MAGFNVGAGLAQMGQTVAQTMGAGMLEQQRAMLERERLTLANTMAAERESKGRAEAHGYDMAKTDKVQQYDMEKTDKTIAAELKRTSISAGASIAAANIGLKGRQMEIDAMAPVRAAQIEAHKAEAAGKALDNELKSSIVGARKELEAATTDGDPLRIKAAREKVDIYDEVSAFRTAQIRGMNVETDSKTQKLQVDKLITDRKDELLKVQNDPARTAELKREISILESSSKENRAEIALWQQQAKLAETAMTATMTRLTSLQNTGLLTDESKALEQTLQKVLKQQQLEFAAASAQAKALLQALDATAPRSPDVQDLSKYVKPKAAAKPAVTAAPPGLIDSSARGAP